jgi:putative endonuclease
MIWDEGRRTKDERHHGHPSSFVFRLIDCMPDLRKNLGDFGEQAAATYLAKRGYALLARKWRCPIGEIDLLMRDGSTLVFVEVRTRRGEGLGTAEESIDRAKQTKLIALAYAYLEATGVPDDRPWRIDVVAVNIDSAGRIAGLEHIRDAVEET